MFGSLMTFAAGVFTSSPSSPSPSGMRWPSCRYSGKTARIRPAREMSRVSTGTARRAGERADDRQERVRREGGGLVGPRVDDGRALAHGGRPLRGAGARAECVARGSGTGACLARKSARWRLPARRGCYAGVAGVRIRPIGLARRRLNGDDSSARCPSKRGQGAQDARSRAAEIRTHPENAERRPRPSDPEPGHGDGRAWRSGGEDTPEAPDVRGSGGHPDWQ